jgi:hypothetical protein
MGGFRNSSGEKLENLVRACGLSMARTGEKVSSSGAETRLGETAVQ